MTVGQPVAALFVRRDSIYKQMPGVDCFDEDRDARTWPGGCPVVAHPPCRGWGSMRKFAHTRKGERHLATWAVRMVRRHGGVLEHPSKSRLWSRCRLPSPGDGRDKHGGWTLGVHQNWFGHRAQKPTILYIVGAAPGDIPPMPLKLGRATHCVRPTKSYPRLPSVTKAEREDTPPEFARWLVELARRCSRADR